MKLETILNALELVCRQPGKWNYRQHEAFRSRILRMDAEKDEEIRFQQQLNKVSNGQIDGLKKDVAYLVHIHKGGTND